MTTQVSSFSHTFPYPLWALSSLGCHKLNPRFTQSHNKNTSLKLIATAFSVIIVMVSRSIRKLLTASPCNIRVGQGEQKVNRTSSHFHKVQKVSGGLLGHALSSWLTWQWWSSNSCCKAVHRQLASHTDSDTAENGIQQGVTLLPLTPKY